MPKLYTSQERANAVVRMYESGMSIHKVGEHVGCTYEGVRQILIKRGVERRPPGTHRRPHYAERMDQKYGEEMAVLYKELGSVVKVAARFPGVGWPTARQILVRRLGPNFQKFYSKPGSFDRLPREAVLDQIRLVSKITGDNPLGEAKYDKVAHDLGFLRACRIQQRFGSWRFACQEAGLEVNETPVGFRAHYARSYKSEVDMRQHVRDCAAALGRIPSYANYEDWQRTVDDAPCGTLVRNRIGFGSWNRVKQILFEGR